MSEPTDDGWPEKYRDPRERPHPDELRVTVETFDRMQDETLETVTAVSDGDPQPAVASFSTVTDLRKILTDRRLELLQELINTDGAADSITALANNLDRDYSTVHDDVTLLSEHGLLFVVDEGQTKRPYVPYERIHLDVELVGTSGSEEPAAV